MRGGNVKAELRKLVASVEVARRMGGFKFPPNFQDDYDRALDTRSSLLAIRIRTELEERLEACFKKAYFEKPLGLELDPDLTGRGRDLVKSYEEFAKTNPSIDELAQSYKKTRAELKLIEDEQLKRNARRRAAQFMATTGKGVPDFFQSDDFVQEIRDSQ